jgi:hypothetical protein
MVVGTGKMVFRLHGCNSLKEKRAIVKAMVNRIKNRFNISIAETAYNESLLKAEIGFSITGNNRRTVNSTMDKVLNMAENMGLAQIIDSEMEILSW